MYAIKAMEPEMARPKNKSQLLRKAKTLQNRVSRQRTEFKRAHAAKQPHKEPRLVSVE